MAGGEATGDSVRVQKTTKSSALCELHVEVEPARVARAFDRAYRELARQVRVRGFRPGKAPRSVLERLYGPAVAEQVERTLVAETFPEVLEQAGVVPVSEPGIESKPPEPAASFAYTARLEVKPPIELPELRGLPARRPQVEVGEEEVDRELDELRQRHAVLVEEPEDVRVARGHLVTVQFEGRIDGEPFEGGHGEDVKLEIGAGRFLPGFEEQLEGATAGEERRVRARFPEQHPRRELAGREAEFDVRIVAIQRREPPALDDEFAKDVGDFDSLDALRQKVRDDLLAAREREARAVLRKTALDALLDRVTVAVPPGVVEGRLKRRLAAAERDLRQAVAPEVLRGQLLRWEEEWRPHVEREIREEWVLEAVAQQQGLTASDEEVDERLAELARKHGVPPARLRREYAERGLVEAIRSQIREERALEFLLGEANVAEGTDG